MSYVDVSGVKIYYEETGSGDPILFVHEYAGDYRSWEPQVRHFARRYRCITYNARGYPPSDVPDEPELYSQDLVIDDIAALLRHLNVKRAHIVGLSMGSYTTLLFGLRYPDLAWSMVVAGTGYGALPETHTEYLTEIDNLATQFEEGGGVVKSQILSTKQSRMPFKKKNPRGWKEFASQMRDHSGKGSALTLRGVQKHRPMFTEVEDQLHNMTVPLLLVVGDEDPPAIDGTLYLKRTSPTAGLCMLPKTGHTANLEEPELFNWLIQDFITTVTAGQWEHRDPWRLADQTTLAAG